MIERPDYSGTWTFNAAKSRLQIQAPDRSVFVVEHREPSFGLTRTHLFQGQQDTWGIELTTDGREVVRVEPGRTLRCRLAWDDDALAFEARILLPDGVEIVDRVKYVMAADRLSITAHESYRGGGQHADNVWVLERQR
jgi:hypothetical protein